MSRLDAILMAFLVGGCVALLAIISILTGYAVFYGEPKAPPVRLVLVAPAVWIIGGVATYKLRGSSFHKWLEQKI